MRGFYVRKDQEVKPGMMQSNKSDKQLLPSEDYLRFLVIDLKKGIGILNFCYYHRSDMQNFKYELYTLDLWPSHGQ